MELTCQQREILAGAKGPLLSTCMRWLVEWGQAMGAQRLVPVANTHALVTVPGNLVHAGGGKALAHSMELLRSVCRHQVCGHCTTHITFAHEEQYDEIEMPSEQVAAQKEVMQIASEAGFLMTHTCAPYLVGNVPVKGEICAWTESSAVVYANSIWERGTTRHGTESALAASLLGCVPEFGVLLDENRRATLQVDVTPPLRTPTDWGAVGYFTGQAAGLEVPVLHGAPQPTQEDVKQLCAALACGGGVTLCHIVGVTPEAPTLQQALGGQPPVSRIEFGGEQLRQTYAQLRTHTDDHIDTVILGCPHASLHEVAQIAASLKGRRLERGVTLWVCMAYATRANAQRLGFARAIEDSGGYLFCDTCPTNSMRLKATRLVTPSFKQAHYARGMIGVEVIVDSLSGCLAAALLGGGKMADELVISCRGVVQGKAEGTALVAPTTLSFWGEVDPLSGRIIARGHPLEGQCLRGKVLVIRSTKGSSATPLVMGLAHQAGNGPVALVNTHIDSLAALGCVVNQIPLVTDLQRDPFALIKTGDQLVVDADKGTVTVVNRLPAGVRS